MRSPSWQVVVPPFFMLYTHTHPHTHAHGTHAHQTHPDTHHTHTQTHTTRTPTGVGHGSVDLTNQGCYSNQDEDDVWKTHRNPAMHVGASGCVLFFKQHYSMESDCQAIGWIAWKSTLSFEASGTLPTAVCADYFTVLIVHTSAGLAASGPQNNVSGCGCVLVCVEVGECRWVGGCVVNSRKTKKFTNIKNNKKTKNKKYQNISKT